ncbi:MAG TPA: chalcone isomerase family protein [Burkholderiaceae bacterium]|nr:chalcone isomerase family protein [Burkholderiaceae bacterium]HQR71629.1 chalcone isomerase family protein [Burkholderiaceae bacterium]
MKSWFRWIAVTALLAFGAAVQAQPVEMEGQKFEPTVQVGGQTLQLNGVGLRKRAIFKVYVNGLYVPQKSTDAATLINEKGPRRASLHMLREVDADSFVSAFTDGMRNNLTEAQMAALKPQIDVFTSTLKSIGEAKKGDVINFDYTPDGGTRISVNGQPRGSAIPGHDFYSAVMRIWLGDKPVDDGLKKGLLGG